MRHRVNSQHARVLAAVVCPTSTRLLLLHFASVILPSPQHPTLHASRILLPLSSLSSCVWSRLLCPLSLSSRVSLTRRVAMSSLDASSLRVTQPSTRPMRLKVLYTFDNEQKTTCLARTQSTYPVRVHPTTPGNDLGVIDLHACLAAVAQASPELLSADMDYVVYTVDFSEQEQPLVGHGLFSWTLASPAAPNAASNNNNNNNTGQVVVLADDDDDDDARQQFVCGRVFSNLINMFHANAHETLEVKLRLSPVPGASHTRFLRSMQLYVRLAKLLQSSFDASAWSSFITANPALVALLTAPAYAARDATTTADALKTQQDDFDAFFGLPQLSSVDVATACISGSAKSRARSTTKKARGPLEDLSAPALNVNVRKPRASSVRPRKPRASASRATPLAVSDEGGMTPDDTVTNRRPLQPLHQQQQKPNTVTTGGNSSSPGSNNESPYESPAQQHLASSPPTFPAVAVDNFPKSWTLGLSPIPGSSQSRSGQSPGTGVTPAVPADFDDLLIADLGADLDASAFLRTATTDFVRDFYTFDTDEEIIGMPSTEAIEPLTMDDVESAEKAAEFALLQEEHNVSSSSLLLSALSSPRFAQGSYSHRMRCAHSKLIRRTTATTANN
ncbi:uncharacterized protein V1518DRAFT_137139 [Limtongia smithiae]|uniref:uncharacterized protein n=1 Tax=Limtongia smithiae TaxID=1125753 RepID=UPI0034CF01EE